jgi:glycosyltransferase involved in cell wall biosynthesis/2-polyprenyl-3-methyl-5-hydroxy-6-metoxy-1,4-benzoquinol methylase
MDSKYKFSFSRDNLYGYALELIEKHSAGEVCIDIGCGWGAIAEPLTERTGLTYIGIDENEDSISNLKERGFEAYCHPFGDKQQDLYFLNSIIGGRRLASISALDILEHIFFPENLLNMLHEFAGKYASPLILSVPNITHRDIAFKLLCGRLDIMPTGILDETHKNLFSEEYLTKVMEEAGWHQIDEKDLISINSDQHFPTELITLADGSLIFDFLTNIRSQAGPNDTTEQFLRVYLPGNIIEKTVQKKDSPFLTVIIRTQGLRPETLKESLLCLTGQSCTDFEVLVLGHKLNIERQLLVERIIADTPKWLRDKIQLLRLCDGNRTKPLNYGYEHANGKYVAVFDDDDLVFSNWVEEFKKTAENNHGKIIRSYCLKQNSIFVKTQYSNKSVAAMGTMERCYVKPFDYLVHLHHNESPFMCLAFPRSVFTDMGYRFDETLSTTEDWDFLLRTVQLCGVVDTGAITCVYRWWLSDESSKTSHDSSEWAYNQDTILRKVNNRSILLPPRSALSIRKIITENINAQYYLSKINNEERLVQKRRFLYLLLTSKTWNLTRIPRVIFRILSGHSGYEIPDLFTATEEQLDYTTAVIINSRSWRWTSWLRGIYGELRKSN